MDSLDRFQRSRLGEFDRYLKVVREDPSLLQKAYEERPFEAVPPPMVGHCHSPSYSRYLTDRYGMHG